MTTLTCAGMRLRPWAIWKMADALSALQQTLHDPDMDVRIFSQRAIDKIQKSMPEASHA
jgi:hypothetical protein